LVDLLLDMRQELSLASLSMNTDEVDNGTRTRLTDMGPKR